MGRRNGTGPDRRIDVLNGDTPSAPPEGEQEEAGPSARRDNEADRQDCSGNDEADKGGGGEKVQDTGDPAGRIMPLRAGFHAGSGDGVSTPARLPRNPMVYESSSLAADPVSSPFSFPFSFFMISAISLSRFMTRKLTVFSG